MKTTTQSCKFCGEITNGTIREGLDYSCIKCWGLGANPNMTCHEFFVFMLVPSKRLNERHESLKKAMEHYDAGIN